MMRPLVIIGYGNTLRGDDALGWHAAQRLSEHNADGLVVEVRHQLTPELAEVISRARAVAFLDARLGGDPGVVQVTAVEPSAVSGDSLTHHLTPGTLLALSQTLYGTCPPAVIFSISAENFELGASLTPRVEAALPALVKRVQEWIAEQSA